jgi:predicted dehydrogenase
MTVRWGVAGPGPVADKVLRDAAGRFAMEAMWTRFCPAVVRLRELVADGAIGEVCTVTADLGLRHPVDPATQAYHPEEGDGLLFHLGVYPVSFAQMLLAAATAGSSWRTCMRT